MSATISSPPVSVCIPAYNSGKTLPETLASILRQDYPNLDIVVSDNQSTDDTVTVIKNLAGQGVRYVYHEAGRPTWAENLPAFIGGFANWDYVLSQGRGDYLCLFHADDIYDPTIISKQVTLMEAYPEVGAVFTMSQGIDELGRYIRPGTQSLPRQLRGRQVFDFKALFNAILRYGNFLRAPSVMLRRSVWEQIDGFDERQFLTAADLEMWLRIGRKFDIGVINEPLFSYRQSDKQFGKQYQKMRTELADYFQVMEAYLGNPEVLSMAARQSLAFYEMERAADQVLCAMNLLVKGQTGAARVRLAAALKGKYYFAALRRPRKFVRLCLGLVMLLAAYVGLGRVVGSIIFSVYRYDLSRRAKPVPDWDQTE